MMLWLYIMSVVLVMIMLLWADTRAATRPKNGETCIPYKFDQALNKVITPDNCKVNEYGLDNMRCDTTTLKCKCEEKYLIGDYCEKAKCLPECGKNGYCVVDGDDDWTLCLCQAGWTGIPACDIPICNPDCGKHGKCTLPNTCICNEGWGGPTCDIREYRLKCVQCKENCNEDLLPNATVCSQLVAATACYKDVGVVEKSGERVTTYRGCTPSCRLRQNSVNGGPLPMATYGGVTYTRHCCDTDGCNGGTSLNISVYKLLLMSILITITIIYSADQ